MKNVSSHITPSTKPTSTKPSILSWPTCKIRLSKSFKNNKNRTISSLHKFLSSSDYASRYAPKSVPSSYSQRESFISVNNFKPMTHWFWSLKSIILKTSTSWTAQNAKILENFCSWLSQNSSKASLTQTIIWLKMKVSNCCTQFTWFWKESISAIQLI